MKRSASREAICGRTGSTVVLRRVSAVFMNSPPSGCERIGLNYFAVMRADSDYSGAPNAPQLSHAILQPRSSRIGRELRHDEELISQQGADHGNEQHGDEQYAARGIDLLHRQHIGFAWAEAA